MSKAESTRAKGLEEILASIRKSLADETTVSPPEPQLAPAKAAQPQPQPKPARLADAPLKASDSFSGRLAGSNKPAGPVNGSAGGPTLDADLSELLATEPTKPAPAPGAAPKDAGANGSGEKDPLWFLSRLSSAAAGPAPQGPAARARDVAKAPNPEEVTLSRPETLRPSLPPLFGENSKPSIDRPPAQEKPGDVAGSTLRTEPRVLPPQAGGGPGAAQASTETSPAPAATNGAMPPGSEAAAQPSPPPAEPNPTAQQTPARSAEPATTAPELPPGNTAQDRPASAAASQEAGASVIGGLSSRALEQMVAELLEPVIRQWLQNNLPRLIESTVREEVARAVAAEREAAKA